MSLGIVVTDLDGTLLGPEREIRAVDRQALLELGARGIVRVVATGRSLFSAQQALPDDTPIDFLVHSSGAGVVDWPARRALRVLHMTAASAARLAEALSERELDFMLHRAIPDNHRFLFHRTGRQNPDFERRMLRYAAYAEPFDPARSIAEEMCQALVIEPPPEPGRYPELLCELSEWSVLRATSPLDGASTWVEVFARGVCKSEAAAWLRARYAPGSVSLAVGNDYNDVDLLDWADLAFVVGNAPPALRARYQQVAAHDAGGFNQAVQQALEAALGSREAFFVPGEARYSSASSFSGDEPSGATGRTRTR